MNETQNLVSKAKLAISDYFDSLVSDIDLQAECLMIHEPENERRINSIRDKFLTRIRDVEKLNMRHIEHLAASNRIEAAEIELFKETCFLVGKNALSEAGLQFQDIDLGLLVIVSENMSYEQIEMFKSLNFCAERNICGLAKYMVKTENNEKIAHERYAYELNDQLKGDRQQQNVLKISSALYDTTAIEITNSSVISLCARNASLFSNLIILNLSYNKITRLEYIINKDIPLSRLVHLDLKRNGIEKLNDNVFSSLVNLSQLDLSFNKIKTVSENALLGLQSLVVLILSGNSLVEIKNDTFRTLDSLHELYIDRNQIEVLSSKSLKGLVKVNRIDLSYNKLSAVDVNVFNASLANLAYLYLNGNLFDQIEAYVFQNLSVLTTLDLTASCNLVEIEKSCFYGLVALVDLAVNCNLLFVEDCAFAELKRLKYLDLSFNRLSFVTAKTFVGLRKLESLKLNSNKIEEVNSAAFSDLLSLKLLNLESNRLNSNASRYLEELKAQNVVRIVL